MYMRPLVLGYTTTFARPQRIAETKGAGMGKRIKHAHWSIIYQEIAQSHHALEIHVHWTLLPEQ